MNPQELTDRWVMTTYRRQPVTFTRGDGVYLFDRDGERYLDLVAGIAVTAIGHAHPAVTEAVASQAGRLVHTSNLYYTEPMAQLAERLCEKLGFDDGRVFFANSGAEANECAIKLVRKWSGQAHGSDRYETIAAQGSFHGRTLETLAATGQPAKWKPFMPLPPGFRHVPYDDVVALRQAVDDRVCSVLLEPVQGEGGVVAPSPGYLPEVRRICDESNLAFIADEVQTGFGRTGTWFAFQHSGARPDVITLAKALGNGLPIGACVARGDVGAAFSPGDHATTIGGGPVLCAAALAVIRVIEQDDLVAHGAKMGQLLRGKLEDLASRHELIHEIRGEGLLLAIGLKHDVAARVVSGCLERKVLVNDVLPNAIRISPALIIDESQCELGIEVLDDVLTRIEREGPG